MNGGASIGENKSGKSVWGEGNICTSIDIQITTFSTIFVAIPPEKTPRWPPGLTSVLSAVPPTKTNILPLELMVVLLAVPLFKTFIES